MGIRLNIYMTRNLLAQFPESVVEAEIEVTSLWARTYLYEDFKHRLYCKGKTQEQPQNLAIELKFALMLTKYIYLIRKPKKRLLINLLQ